MRFLSKKEVRARIGLSPTQFHVRLREAGKFPIPVQIGYRVFYVDEEIDAWMRARLKERPTDPPEREDKSTE
ncbi:MAG TPA: AlpA family phage regulatory protein [Stellaceae bacterium]|nr:AlpA family phage regulatory protein [Stellaceae bacterium]